ncbi:MAG: ABC transporter ATP-binding protein [Thermodesulfobacteriota bacterium]
MTKDYGRRRVLDVAELDLEEGRVYALLGPNGAGKTTLLEILAFLLTPTTGRIIYRGQQVDYSPAGLLNLRRQVILIPQTPILFTTTVQRNVEFGLKVRNFSKRQRLKTVEEMLDLVGLKSMAAASAHKLSGGETQRVAIARALACWPKVMLFDEPTSNVDVENQIAIENIIKTINEEKGLSILVTTHNVVQAAKLAQARVFLYEGRPAGHTYENIFMGRMVETEAGRFCHVQDRLRLPLDTPQNGWVRISVHPQRLKIIKPRNSSNPAWLGRVLQLTDEDDQVRVLVDLGLPITALLNKSDYRRSPILVGEEVEVEFPSGAVEII